MPSEDALVRIYAYIPTPNMHYLRQLIRTIKDIYEVVSFNLKYSKFEDTSHAMYFSRLSLK